MIPASRFIETSDNHEAWLAARLLAVTATEVAEASTPSGFQQAVYARRYPQHVEANAFMRFGSDNEDWIARDLKRKYDVMPNHWLIASADEPLFMATPDGLSLDHKRMAEIKTGGTEPPKPPLKHLRQMGWQFVCNEFAEEIIYAFMLRASVNGVLVPAWLEPKTWIVRRDDPQIVKLMPELRSVAARLIESDKEIAA